MIKIIYSAHAVQRMEERGISKIEVATAMTNPDRLETREDTKAVIKKRNNGHLLIIIYRKISTDFYKIITVITTSKVNKYL